MAERQQPWMKVAIAIPSSPKTIDTAETLDICVPQLIGHLTALWAWAFAHAPDGMIGSYSAQHVATGALWVGDPNDFVGALHRFGWVDDDGGLHEWPLWGGALHILRGEWKERKTGSRGSHGEVTEKSHARGEERREEESRGEERREEESKGAAEAAKENPYQPTHDQIYLAERLTEEWNQPLSPAALVKLNKKHGVAAVTSALRELRGFPPANAIRKLYAYVDTMAGMEER